MQEGPGFEGGRTYASPVRHIPPPCTHPINPTFTIGKSFKVRAYGQLHSPSF